MRLELAVGSLFLATMLVLAFLVSRVSDNGVDLSNAKVFYSQVVDSTGLPEGAVVRVAGIDVGRMTQKELAGKEARLRLEIRGDIEVHEDSSITLRSIGYLGDRYLDLDTGSEQAPLKAEKALVKTYEGATFEGLMEGSSGLLETLAEVARRIGRLIGTG